MIAIAIALAAGCVRGPLVPTLPEAPRTWSVAVSVAAGDRVLDELHELRTSRVSGDVFEIATIRSRGTWTEHGAEQSFDSAGPSGRDPWPLLLQHAVAAVPAQVRFVAGRPTELVEPDAWTEEARAAMAQTKLPSEALDAADNLVDPGGLLLDLVRTFPGLPPPEGPWERPDRIAGLDVTRRETCSRTALGWACAGLAAVAPETWARTFELRTFTEIAVDRDGLVWVESGYTGTLVTLAPGGGDVADRPISGLRRVQRGLTP